MLDAPLDASLGNDMARGHIARGFKPRRVIAIPVRNEQARIAACLQALARQRDESGRVPAVRDSHVLLLLNGCTDGTRQAIEAAWRDLPMAMSMLECRLPTHSDHAGGARALALRLALARVDEHPQAIVLSTDADSQVPRHWLARMSAAMARGVDAVAGQIHVAAEDQTQLPLALRARQAAEQAYQDLLDEIDARTDPVAHDPWPCHRMRSGANMAIKASALRHLRELPEPACGEDRALIAALQRHDFLVRHEPGLSVQTSGRLRGRAHGGMADTLWQRSHDPAAPCDPLLEPAREAYRRAALRRLMRLLHSRRQLGRALLDEGHRPEVANAPLAAGPARGFGELWHGLEADSLLLRRRRLGPDELHRETAIARAILAEPNLRPASSIARSEQEAAA